MIYYIEVTKGMTREQAGQHQELDFWRLLGYGNLDKGREADQIKK